MRTSVAFPFCLLTTIGAVATLSGCSSVAPKIETASASADFVNGTHVLAEVRGPYSRDEVLHNKQNWTEIKDWHEALLAVGYTDDDINDFSEVASNTFSYSHNSASGVYLHRGFYVSHIPSSLQGKVTFKTENHQQVREHGDLIEIELVQTPSKKLVGTVVAIYRPADNWGSCRIETLRLSEFEKIAYQLSPFGPPAARWLDCDGLEKEGWRAREIPGAPFGSKDNYVHEWVKVPAVPANVTPLH